MEPIITHPVQHANRLTLGYLWCLGCRRRGVRAVPFCLSQFFQTVADLLRQIADRKNATPAQIALAWLLAQKPWIVPIPGTTKLHRLEENIDADEIELTAEDLREIDRAASQIDVQGARYPEELERRTGL